ncbi:MAG: hypothetical protein Q9191_004766, partial [Dirinaria sp. TL-2023a]
MDNPETPTPSTRRTTLATRPIRSTRLFNLGGSNDASTRPSDGTPSVATASTQDLNGGHRARSELEEFTFISPFDRVPSGASNLQSRRTAADSSGTNALRDQSGGSMLESNTQTSVNRPTTATGNSFEERAASQGLRPWDRNVFDDRWDLNQRDIRQMDSHHGGTIAPAPSEPATTQNVPSTSVAIATPGQRRAPPTLNNPSTAPELQEVKNLNSCIRGLLGENGRISSAFPYPPEAVRHMLYTRTFGNADRPKPLDGQEASNLLMYRGNFVTRRFMRDEVLSVIEAVVSNLTRSPSTESSDSQSDLAEWLDVTSISEVPSASLLTQNSQSHTLYTQVDVARAESQSVAIPHGQSRISAQAANRSAYIAHQQPQMSAQAANHNVSIAQPQPQASSQPENQNISVAHPQLQSSVQAANQNVPITHPQPQAIVQPAFLPSHPVPPMPPMYVPAGPLPAQGGFGPGIGYSPQRSAMPYGFQPQWPIAAYGQPAFPYQGYHQYAPPMFQPPPTYAHFPAQPMINGPMIPAPMPNFNFGANLPSQSQLMNAGPPPAVEMNHPSTPVSNQFSTTPARASTTKRASTTRRALLPPTFNVSLWAQEHRPPTPAGQPSWSNSGKRGTRSGPEDNADPTPDLAPMPYRAGTDPVRPEGETGPSEELKAITSKGDSSFETVTDPENIVFSETARESKPARWGVVRIGN